MNELLFYLGATVTFFLFVGAAFGIWWGQQLLVAWLHRYRP